MKNDAFSEQKLLEEEWLSELKEVVGDVPVYLCGKPSSLDEVASKQVRERGRYTYMADLVTDDKGLLTRVCYDRVSL